jgi:hypothetical protein
MEDDNAAFFSLRRGRDSQDVLAGEGRVSVNFTLPRSRQFGRAHQGRAPISTCGRTVDSERDVLLPVITK